MTYPQAPNFRTSTFGDAWWRVARNGVAQLIETDGLATTVQIQMMLFNGVPSGTRTFDGVTPHQVRIDGVLGPDSLRALWAYGKTVMAVPATAFAQIQADAAARRITAETYRIALWLAYNQPRNVDLTEGPTNARRRVRRTDPAILWIQTLGGVSLAPGAQLPQWLERPAIPVNTNQSPAPPQVTALSSDGTRTTDVMQVPDEPTAPPPAQPAQAPALVPETATPVGTTPTPAPATTPDTNATPDDTSATPATPPAAASSTNYVPWILGGLAVAAAVGIGIAVTRKKDAHPALGPSGPSGRPAPAGMPPHAAPPLHANPSDARGSTTGGIHQQHDVPRWVLEHGISDATRRDRINQALALAMKMNNRKGDAIVGTIWEGLLTPPTSPELLHDFLRSPLWHKFASRAATRL